MLYAPSMARVGFCFFLVAVAYFHERFWLKVNFIIQQKISFEKNLYFVSDMILKYLFFSIELILFEKKSLTATEIFSVPKNCCIYM